MTPPGPSPALYAGGVRSLLLHGGAELAEPFLKQQLVDAVDVFLPVSDPSARAQPDPATAALGSEIRTVTRLDFGLLLRADWAELEKAFADQ